MIGPLRGAAIVTGVVGGVIVAIAMLLGPLLDEPRPGAVERFAIFAMPVLLIVGGIVVAFRGRLGVIYGGLALLAAAAYAGFRLTGGDAWDTPGQRVGYTALALAPALVFAVLSWTVYREEQ